TADGSVWLATNLGLYRWKDGRVTIPPTGPNELPGKLRGQFPNSLFEDHRGRIWIATIRETGYLADSQFVSIAALPDEPALSIAEDTNGDMWFTYQQHGLARLSQSGTVTLTPWSTFGQEFAKSIVADPRKGGVWLGFVRSGGIAYLVD